MAIVGQAIRQAQALDRAAAEPCEGCGHPRGDHAELVRSTLELVEGELVERMNPAYRAFHFHCRVEGCGCVLDRTGS